MVRVRGLLFACCVWTAALFGVCVASACAAEPHASPDAVPGALPQSSAATLPAPSLDAMLGQMVMAGFRGLTVADSDPIAQDIAAGRVGGVILFDRDLTRPGPRNVANPAQVAALVASLQRRAAIALFVAVDQEGGRVMRLGPKNGFPPLPAARTLGQGSPAVTEAMGAATGRVLADAGANLDFAPVADVDVNPDNPVIGKLERSFSADPETVALHAAAFARGLRGAGVLACLKHFPGHGSAWNDSHFGMADVTATWTEAELVPYRRLLSQGGADMVMTGHLFNARLDQAHPATLSFATITGLLRGTLGYDGVVVSDDMQMRAVAAMYGLRQAVALAVNAGVDILLFGNNLSYDPVLPATAHRLLKELVASREIPLERIEASYRRIMRLKAALRR
ncbi:MAG: glycoside hydrolase family 3 protein [Desulfovibrionaceae bacterium]